MDKMTASIRKTVKSLSTAKGRRMHNAFVTERTKNVLDLIDGPFTLKWLLATQAWFDSHKELISEYHSLSYLATSADMERMTSLNTHSDVMAVFDMPEESSVDVILKDNTLYLALDGIQDPGNLGTIIRIADWFGVHTIFAGKDTVSVFNTKCVISTMGSIARVKVVYCDLPHLLEQAENKKMNVWGTFLDGENIYDMPLGDNPAGIIVMGNEGNGISDSVAQYVTRRLLIPTYPRGRNDIESLNVAMATAITLSYMRSSALKS